MAKLGEYLILTAFSHNCRLERAFKCLGTNLTEFLTTLDSVHDVLHDQVGFVYSCVIYLFLYELYLNLLILVDTTLDRHNPFLCPFTVYIFSNFNDFSCQ